MADVEEVEREFRRYFMTGPVLEDWQAWAHLSPTTRPTSTTSTGPLPAPRKSQSFLN
jgi:hypothetical protein